MVQSCDQDGAFQVTKRQRNTGECQRTEEARMACRPQVKRLNLAGQGGDDADVGPVLKDQRSWRVAWIRT